jgi:acylphosphatase
MLPAMQRLAVRLSIQGRVQGVGYRWWALQEAERLGLAGWVRNRSDGSVEVLAIGLEEVIDELVDACGRGPPAAAVTSVEAFEAENDGSVGFRERPTI